MSQIFDFGKRIHMIDLNDLDMNERTGSYVILEDKLTIIETSASPSVPHLLKGLDKLGKKPEEVEYIIVTHIHLDHAGGVGLFLQHCPNAKVIVHPKGYQHLKNPERLIAGARAVYGEKFDQLFNPILPVPEERLIVKNDRETLHIGNQCELTFFDTPGHAKHHFSILDPVSNGIFTGDTIGIYYHMLKDLGIEFYLPSTSPNQFNPEDMLRSLSRIQELNVDRIYFGHFGVSHNPNQVYEQIKIWTPLFIKAGQHAFEENYSKNFEELVEITYNNLNDYVSDFLDKNNVPPDHKVHRVLMVDLKVSAMGIVDYLLKKALLT